MSTTKGHKERTHLVCIIQNNLVVSLSCPDAIKGAQLKVVNRQTLQDEESVTYTTTRDTSRAHRHQMCARTIYRARVDRITALVVHLRADGVDVHGRRCAPRTKGNSGTRESAVAETCERLKAGELCLVVDKGTVAAKDEEDAFDLIRGASGEVVFQVEYGHLVGQVTDPKGKARLLWFWRHSTHKC